MEEDDGVPRLSKRFSDNKDGGEVDYKTKAGTAWSHSFLNQKPWHPLSYPNQRRKWIAEQTHAQRQRRNEEISREYAQEQEFFRQTALVSKKEKEKMEMMKAVSFMYVRPPGYNPESAKAAEVEDERRKQDQAGTSQSQPEEGSAESKPESLPPIEEKKKPRPKDVFGRLLPTEEQFEVLKNAPRLDTGAPARAKPFAVEIRNVKCVRCGTFGHQSGDRECPLKDAIMPNEENRLKRDDPLTAILAQTESSEPLKWELKQKPGLSPPRGGFRPDDPNQQIVAEEIFDEYGGFLAGDSIPDLLSNFSSKSKKKKKKLSKSHHKMKASPSSSDLCYHEESATSSEDERGRRSKRRAHRKKSRRHSESTSSDDSDSDRRHRRKAPSTSRDFRDHEETASSDDDRGRRSKKRRHKKNSRRHSESSSSQEESDSDRHRKRDTESRHSRSYSSRHSDSSRKDTNRDYSRHSDSSRKDTNRDYSRHSDSSRKDTNRDYSRHSDSSRKDTNRDYSRHSDSSRKDTNRDSHRYQQHRCHSHRSVSLSE